MSRLRDRRWEEEAGERLEGEAGGRGWRRGRGQRARPEGKAGGRGRRNFLSITPRKRLTTDR